MIRRNATLFGAILGVLIAVSSAVAAPKPVPAFRPGPTLSALDKAVTEMSAFLNTYGQSLSDEERARLTTLLEQQRKQLDAVKAKYPSADSTTTRRQFTREMDPFFRTGGELQRVLKSAKPAVTAQDYSPDPSQCAEHCHRTCGYDSVGEKVCWYTCYYCCGKGGC